MATLGAVFALSSVVRRTEVVRPDRSVATASKTTSGAVARDGSTYCTVREIDADVPGETSRMLTPRARMTSRVTSSSMSFALTDTVTVDPSGALAGGWPVANATVGGATPSTVNTR